MRRLVSTGILLDFVSFSFICARSNAVEDPAKRDILEKNFYYASSGLFVDFDFLRPLLSPRRTMVLRLLHHTSGSGSAGACVRALI